MVSEELKDTKVYKYVIAMDLGAVYSGYTIGSMKEKTLYFPDMSANVGPGWEKKDMPSSVIYTTHTWWQAKCGKEAEEKFKNKPTHPYYIPAPKAKLGQEYMDKTKVDPPQTKPSSTEAMASNISSERAFYDYFKYMRKSIEKTLPYRYTSRAKLSDCVFCVGVPATWTNEQKGLVREAATYAHLLSPPDNSHKMVFVNECEATALYIEEHNPEIDEGDLYMICDAGGGTVDLTVFEKGPPSEKRQLKQITMSTSTLSGSKDLDKEFKLLLDPAYKKGKDEKDGYEKYKNIYDILREFHELKKTFNGDQYDLDQNDWEAFIVKCNRIKREKDHNLSFDSILSRVFDPVVCKIIDAIDEQLVQLESGRSIRMFISGGFGQSPYLQKRIQDKFEEKIKNIQIVKDGHKAIMSGATMFIKSVPLSIQRISCFNYYVSVCSKKHNFKLRNTQCGDHKCLVEREKEITIGQTITNTFKLKKNVNPLISLDAYDQHGGPHKNDSSHLNHTLAIYEVEFFSESNKFAESDEFTVEVTFLEASIDIKAKIEKNTYTLTKVWDSITKRKEHMYDFITQSSFVRRDLKYTLETLSKSEP